MLAFFYDGWYLKMGKGNSNKGVCCEKIIYNLHRGRIYPCSATFLKLLGELTTPLFYTNKS
jgi:hypothetical protein